jgi:hypothetical protein
MARNSVTATDGIHENTTVITWRGDGYTHQRYDFYIYRWIEGEKPQFYQKVKSLINGSFTDHAPKDSTDYHYYKVTQPDSFGNHADHGTDRG